MLLLLLLLLKKVSFVRWVDRLLKWLPKLVWGAGEGPIVNLERVGLVSIEPGQIPTTDKRNNQTRWRWFIHSVAGHISRRSNAHFADAGLKQPGTQGSVAREAPAHNKGLYRRVPTAFWLRDRDIRKEKTKLFVEKPHVPPSENFGDEAATASKHVRCDAQCSENELRLHKLVNVVETSDIRSSITDDNVRLEPPKMADDLQGSGRRRDIPPHLPHSWNRSHLLEVHGNDLLLPWRHFCSTSWVEFAG
mmetsp:Transcript_26342/g.76808  ORF Transcript_26342/g.76808 Transcript_26342/m.76808 type:complete len:248 (+) Transcript_26342:131-874(+)